MLGAVAVPHCGRPCRLPDEATTLPTMCRGWPPGRTPQTPFSSPAWRTTRRTACCSRATCAATPRPPTPSSRSACGCAGPGGPGRGAADAGRPPARCTADGAVAAAVRGARSCAQGPCRLIPPLFPAAVTLSQAELGDAYKLYLLQNKDEKPVRAGRRALAFCRRDPPPPPPPPSPLRPCRLPAAPHGPCTQLPACRRRWRCCCRWRRRRRRWWAARPPSWPWPRPLAPPRWPRPSTPSTPSSSTRRC